ncbi:cyclic peptide export ABC transporter [Campylobacter mucosalis]|uniref:cyclic peptide export ABC transporter n=1 Tax=Campylobacter mucosalis TaxID=202 RepID=UPI0014700FBE|nr:cyclic peptide export ABC transporter [Campylobacter mucosalis]
MIKEILKQNTKKLLLIAILTAIYSGFGIATLSFINEKLLAINTFDISVIFQFLALLFVFFISSVVANIMLTNFGHSLVYNIRKRLIKQILDTPNAQIDLIGKAKIIASLNNDIRTISFAFMSAPNLLQGSIFIICVSLYLFYISPILFAFVFVWLGFTLGIGVIFMQKIHKYFKLSRSKDDELQHCYNDVVEGHRELSLNVDRARIVFDELDSVATKKRDFMIKADIFHALSDNFGNIMILGLVGFCIFLCLAYSLAPLSMAVTASLAILFLRGSLISMIASIPVALSAKVSLDKISKLEFADFKENFEILKDDLKDWQEISLDSVNFSYDNSFAIKNVSLKLRRGELVFLIGKNGSGKSTLVNLICGLLMPSSGKILIDSVALNEQNLKSYQQNISAIFSDFYLFSQAITQGGLNADNDVINDLLKLLQMDKKVSIIDSKLSTTSLSQGQRKRLGLFLALLERRSLLILDEWAADQDPIFKRVFYREILPLLKSWGISILAISHDDGYFDIADRVFMASNGMVRELVGDELKIASKDAIQKLEDGLI